MLQTVGTEYIKKASDFSEVLVYDAEGNKLISTAEMPLDGNGKDYYGEELEQLLKESKDSKKSEYAFLWKNGMETVAVSMYDWRNVGTEEIVVAVVDEQAMEQEKAENYQELKVLMTILFVTSSMLLAIFGILYQYRWNYFLRKVQTSSHLPQVAQIAMVSALSNSGLMTVLKPRCYTRKECRRNAGNMGGSTRTNRKQGTTSI